jgi:predicted alpha/beta-fold hydrolase
MPMKKINHLFVRQLTPLISFVFFIAFACPVHAEKLRGLSRSDPALIGMNGFFATAFSNLKGMPRKKVKSFEREFVLSDGTKIGGLLMLRKEKASWPLIIANFGALSDRRSNSTSGFVKELVLTGRMKAHVLIMDSVSSAGFFNSNQWLSLGGYDEGRILLQLARVLRTEMPEVGSIHLMGVSLGGAAVMHALHEDARLGFGIFSSAITFSGVIDYATETRTVFSTFGRDLDLEGPPRRLGWGGRKILSEILKGFKAGIKLPEGTNLDSKKAGEFFYAQFAKRLEYLKNSAGTSDRWNPAVKLDSIEDYVRSTSQLIAREFSTSVPVIVIHSKNDPVVSYRPFDEFARREMGNPLVLTHSTRFGGHWGYLRTYGNEWILETVERMLELGMPAPASAALSQ